MANDWDNVKKMLNNATIFFTTSKTVNSIGKYTSSTIKKRTRLGKGVDRTGGPQTKLEIKENTKRTRRYLRRAGSLSAKTQPAKANLTRSGKMLDSVHYTVSGDRKEITTKVAPKQQNKANELDRMGHKFMDLTKGEIKGLIELLVRALLKQIK